MRRKFPESRMVFVEETAQSDRPITCLVNQAIIDAIDNSRPFLPFIHISPSTFEAIEHEERNAKQEAADEKVASDVELPTVAHKANTLIVRFRDFYGRVVVKVYLAPENHYKTNNGQSEANSRTFKHPQVRGRLRVWLRQIAAKCYRQGQRCRCQGSEPVSKGEE